MFINNDAKEKVLMRVPVKLLKIIKDHDKFNINNWINHQLCATDDFNKKLEIMNEVTKYFASNTFAVNDIFIIYCMDTNIYTISSYLGVNKEYKIYVYSELDLNIDIMNYYFSKNINIHVNEKRVLKWSVDNGFSEIIKYLIKNNVNIHLYNDYALRISAEHGRSTVVEFLIKQGANIYADDCYALKWSAYNGHFEIIKILKNMESIFTFNVVMFFELVLEMVILKLSNI